MVSLNDLDIILGIKSLSALLYELEHEVDANAHVCRFENRDRLGSLEKVSNGIV